MEHWLDDCYLKIERAKEQVKSLQGEIGAWGEANPLEAFVGFDAETGELLAKIPEVPLLPGRWAVLVGEIGHNLRSALDYLVFQLAKGSEEKRTAFPISEGKRAYFKARGKGPSYRDQCLSGVPAKWASWIDELQPFKSPFPSTQPRELAILNQLSNRDKHRVRLACLLVVELPFGFVTLDEPNLVRNLNLRCSPDGRELTVRQELAAPAKKGTRMPFSYDPKLPPDGKFGALDVVFGRHRIRVKHLWVLAGYVEFIVGSLYPAMGTD